MSKRIIRLHLRRAVLVTLKSGETFRGVLYDADAESVLLRNAEVVAFDTAGSSIVDGELLVLRPDIAYMQFAG